MRFALLLIACVCYGQNVEQNNSQLKRTLELKTKKSIWTYGRPLVLLVSFQNQSKDPWVLERPDKSRYSGVKYLDVSYRARKLGHTFGRLEQSEHRHPDGSVQTWITIPKVEKITIAPGKSYDFEVTIEGEWWTGWMAPGVWHAWVYYTREGHESDVLKSQVLVIPQKFTMESIEACIEKIGNEGFRGHWTAESKWLTMIRPDLSFKWPNRNYSDKEKKAMLSRTERNLAEFKAYVKDPKNAKAIRDAIAEINRNYKVPAKTDANPSDLKDGGQKPGVEKGAEKLPNDPQ